MGTTKETGQTKHSFLNLSSFLPSWLILGHCCPVTMQWRIVQMSHCMTSN